MKWLPVHAGWALLVCMQAGVSAGEEKTPAPKPNLYKERPVVLVPLVTEAPVLDGKLTEAVWAKATPLALRRLDGGDEKPKLATEARLLSTKEILYIGIRCEEVMKDLKSQERARDDGEIWRDDSVEVFLKAGESAEDPYHQVIINLTGALYDGYERSEAWNGKDLKVSVFKEEKAWVVELAIPFADLKLPEKDKKEVLAGGWRLNFVRNRPARGNDELEEMAWSPTKEATSHVPGMFGYAFFETYGGKIPETPPKAPEGEKKP